MRVLADTNLFVKFYHRQPLPVGVKAALESDVVEKSSFPVSIIEIYRLWQGRRILIDPETWLDEALKSWTVLAITAPIARPSALWEWAHRDPADRILAATAKFERIDLWHTNPILKKWPASRSAILPTSQRAEEVKGS